MAITKEDRNKMLSIAKPELLDLTADQLMKETAMTLLARVEKEGSGVGDTILELMLLAYNQGREDKQKGTDGGKE